MVTISATIRVLSILVGALSVASFVQALLDIGLVPSLEALISFYRGLAVAVFGWPAALIGLEVPQPLVDFWTVSFVGAGAYVRTRGIEQSRALCGLNLDAKSIWWRVCVLLIFGFSGVGVAVVLGAVAPLTYVDAFHEEPLDLMKGAAKNVLFVCAGAIAFFVLNAYSPAK